MKRPVLLGMNQPVEEAEALDPRLYRSAGYNLWQMTRNFCGLSVDEFREAFDRRNVLTGRVWAAAAAREASGAVRRALAGRRVVVLGRAPAAALGLPWLPAGQWGAVPVIPENTIPYSVRESDIVRVDLSINTFDYTCVPHPSGLNRTYNDLETRLATGRLLASLYMSWRDSLPDPQALLPSTGGVE